MLVNGKPAEYCVWQWQDTDAEHLGVNIGNPAHQAFWEVLTVGLALCQWSKSFTTTALAVLNDNVGALQAALDMTGRRTMLAVAREIAWRKAKNMWAYEVAHIPTEQNKLADSLSRLHAPDAEGLPQELSQARRCEEMSVRDFWKLREA
jgi:hypothetical protein